jgi:hypothetical protein
LIEGIALETDEGGVLRVGSETPDAAGQSVSVCHLASIGPIAGRASADETAVFSLSTALADADGVLWERRRSVTIFELWDAALKVGHLELLQHPAKPGLGFEQALRIRRRTVLEAVETVCDGRDRAFVEVLISAQPPARLERLLFQLHFKYFGARIGLIEDQMSFARPPGAEAQMVNLALTIEPHVDANCIACLDESYRLKQGGASTLMGLGPLCARGLAIKGGWGTLAGEPPRRADIDAWRRAFEPHMDGAALERALEPNPRVMFDRRS